MIGFITLSVSQVFFLLETDMREIKFRAWDTKLNELIYEGFHILGECMMSGLLFDRSIERLNDILIEQFTGLHDKNGKEIFEGDIVNHGDNFPSVVKYDEKSCSFRLYENKPKYARGYRFYPRDHEIDAYTSPIEVLGNIHENPELING